MKEMIAKILYEIEKQHDLMLVTLIESDGSAPRKTGSQMLVGDRGLILGSIGGGAVEKLSIERAVRLIGERRSDLHHFTLRPNDREDIGMICGGDVTALFQFIGADDPLWQQLCSKACGQFEKHEGGWFVQRLDGSVPALLDPEKHLLCGSEPKCETPEGKNLFTAGEYFWQTLPTAERVLIFGGGHIAAALVPLLSPIGFRCWVCDNREEFTTAERFPQAEERLTVDYERLADYVEITDKDYVVIMTNGHRWDLAVQDHVLRRPFAYVGVIGSRRKTAAVNAKLRELGIPEEAIARVHTPIGVPIKAVTPEEIAVSIAGELILVRAERREAGGEQIHSCPMH